MLSPCVPGSLFLIECVGEPGYEANLHLGSYVQAPGPHPVHKFTCQQSGRRPAFWKGLDIVNGPSYPTLWMYECKWELGFWTLGQVAFGAKT